MSPPGTKSTVGLWASSAGDRALSLRIAPKVILARLQFNNAKLGRNLTSLPGHGCSGCRSLDCTLRQPFLPRVGSSADMATRPAE